MDVVKSGAASREREKEGQGDKGAPLSWDITRCKTGRGGQGEKRDSIYPGLGQTLGLGINSRGQRVQHKGRSAELD